MTAARMVLGVGAGVLVAVCACTPAALDPTGTPTTGGNGESTGQGGAPADDLVGALRALAPSQEIVVGTNGGEVIPAEHGPIRVFSDRDPEALTEAAAVVGLAVCSIEPQALAFSSATSNEMGLSTADAVAFCATDDLADMTGRLNQLKTPSMVVVIAANAAITVHSTNGGINFYGGDDIGRTLRAARRLYIPACIVTPDVLSVPTPPDGESPGLTVDEALVRCGRM